MTTSFGADGTQHNLVIHIGGTRQTGTVHRGIVQQLSVLVSLACLDVVLTAVHTDVFRGRIVIILCHQIPRIFQVPAVLTHVGSRYHDLGLPGGATDGARGGHVALWFIAGLVLHAVQAGGTIVRRRVVVKHRVMGQAQVVGR